MWSALAWIFGGAFSQVLVLYNIVKDIPTFWLVIQNFSKLSKIWDDLETVSVNLFQNGHVTCEDSKLMIDALRLAFASGLIDLPMLDEAAFANMLYNIENSIQCQIPVRPDTIKIPEVKP